MMSATVSAFPKPFRELDELHRLRLCEAVEWLDAVLQRLPFARRESDYSVVLNRLLQGLSPIERRQVAVNLELVTRQDLN